MCNSYYSFIPIILKLYRCCEHALKICIVFVYYLHITFVTFFSQFELSHFSGILTMKVNGQWVPCVRNFSYSLIPILLKLYRCCDHALKICILFGYNPQIILLPFFSQFELSHFGHFSKWIEGTLCARLLLQFNTDTFENLQTL